MSFNLLGFFRSTAEVKSITFLLVSGFIALFWFVWPWLIFIGYVGGVYLLGRKLAAGRRANFRPPLNGKVAVVTGANTGIGKETAFEFLDLGATVIMACRSKSRAEDGRVEIIARIKTVRGAAAAEAATARLHVLELDLCNFDSIRAFAADVNREFPVVDILVNNAGIMMCPFNLIKPTKSAPKGIESQFLSNHVGHFLLTDLLLDNLKKAEAGRIVNLSSVACFSHNRLKIDTQAQGYNPTIAYGNSKLANILHARELQRRLNAEPGNKVTVYSAHPGGVLTELTRYFSAPQLIDAAAPLIVSFFRYPNEGCQTSLYCALDPSAKPGEYHSDCQLGYCSDAGYDMSLAAELWTMTEKIIAASEGHEKKQ